MTEALEFLAAIAVTWWTGIEYRVRHPRDRQKTTEGAS
jgi:hypothetical protein